MIAICFLFHCRLRRRIAGPFTPDLHVSSHLFTVTHDAKLIITAGHWDNSFRVFTSKGRLLSRIVAHTGMNCGWENTVNTQQESTKIYIINREILGPFVLESISRLMHSYIQVKAAIDTCAFFEGLT